jgi:hypothetical protein
MRDTMIIYRSFYEAIKELPKENQADIWSAVYELGLNGVEIDLQGISKTIFTLIKPQIEANLKRFENGSKPKTKREKSETEAKPKRKVSETEANNNNNNNNNKNIVIRKQEFAASLEPYLDTYGKQMLNDFYLYWTEHAENDRKMRFEKEKAFGIERRLLNWDKNKNKFGNFSDDSEPKELQILRKYAKKQG